MKRHIAFAGLAAATLLAAGCSTTTEIYDPNAANAPQLRDELTVSGNEMLEVAQAATADALRNPNFLEFLASYKAEAAGNGDTQTRPRVMLHKVKNETSDPALNAAELTDTIFTELLNSGVVRVSMATGSEASGSLAQARDLEYDENFDQSSVQKRGTLQAARLAFEPKIVDRTVTQGNQKAIERFFVMNLIDLQTGDVIWRYNKSTGFLKTKGTFGW